MTFLLRRLCVVLGVAQACSLVPVVWADPILVGVPGTADPWLAGMPAGSKASLTDTAPGQSPVQVNLPLVAGQQLSFRAYGLVGYGPRFDEVAGPDGGHWTTHDSSEVIKHGFPYALPGPENGIANYNVPVDSLVGVFLSSAQPNLSATPVTLDFRPGGNVLGGVNYSVLNPGLKQVFFIGDGLNKLGDQQFVTVPTGATRLYLGTADGFDWANNTGAFAVVVNAKPGTVSPSGQLSFDSTANLSNTPEPASLTLFVVGGFGMAVYRLRRRQCGNAVRE
jgi:hypothetical protein